MFGRETMLVRRHLAILLTAGLVSLADSRLCYSQEPESDNPQAKKPVGLILKNAPLNSAGDSAPPKIEQLSDLAFRLLHYTSDAGCNKDACKILVTNFVLPNGYASQYGAQVADQLAAEIARQGKSVQVIDRSLMQVLLNELEQDRVPRDILSSEPLARWLGTKLDATIVLVGVTKRISVDLVEASSRFLNTLDINKIGPSAEVNLIAPEIAADLSPMQSYPPLPSPPESFEGEQVYRSGVNGVGVPSCYYMPSPSYTEDARTFRFSGTVLTEGIVGPDGTVRSFRFVRGAPYGMNKLISQTLNTWKCKPATLEGRPVSVFVPFEVTFRLF